MKGLGKIFDFIFKPLRDATSFASSNSEYIDNKRAEIAMVKSVTSEDMEQFAMIPYQFNGEVKHYIAEHSHPYAYIDLNAPNRASAINALRDIDVHIRESSQLSHLIPHNIRIPIDRIIFDKISPYYGYTRLICTPYTKSGKISKFPVCLKFTTALDIPGTETLGNLFYGQDGSILKADVNIWNNGVGYFFKFKTVGRTFLLYQISSTIKTKANNLPDVIYQFSF